MNKDKVKSEELVYEGNDDMEDDCPCATCGQSDYCDGWEARFCCTLCEYLGGGDCGSCDPMDI